MKSDENSNIDVLNIKLVAVKSLSQPLKLIEQPLYFSIHASEVKVLRSSKANLPKTMEMEGSVMREAEWGEMNVAYNTTAKEFDVTPLLKGLPNDMCQSPHWGYIIKAA